MTHLSQVVQRALRESVEDTLRKVVSDSTTKALTEVLTNRPDVKEKMEMYLARSIEKALIELLDETEEVH